MTKPKPPEHADALIAELHEGDTEARDKLLEYGWRFMRWYATRPTLRAPTRPSDVGGNATLSLVKSIGTFGGKTIKEFEGWLIAIVTNEAKGSMRQNKRRKAKAHHVIVEQDVVAEQNQRALKTPSANVAASDDWHAVYSAMHKLPKNQSKAVYLKLVEERSVKEIAEVMGQTSTAVDGLIQRGVKGLRVQLVPETEGVARKTTRRERERVRAGLSEYLQKIDAGENVDIEAFVAMRAPESESLRELLEWIRHIRLIGGNFS